MGAALDVSCGDPKRSSSPSEYRKKEIPNLYSLGRPPGEEKMSDTHTHTHLLTRTRFEKESEHMNKSCKEFTQELNTQVNKHKYIFRQK
jgi:hypothetical protein